MIVLAAAGVPVAQVIKAATWYPAMWLGQSADIGSVVPDIRRTRLVIKDGALIDVRGLYREIGIAWR